MIRKIKSGILNGVGGYPIDIEVDISKGMPYFSIVGLAGVEVKESKERVRSAINNSGYIFPLHRIVVNLSPADLRKDGSYLDLGICIGLLKDKLNCDESFFESTVFLGELSLDGGIKHMNGIISIVISMIKLGIKNIFIPNENLLECIELENINIYPVSSVRECIKVINMTNSQKEKYIINKKEEAFSFSEKLEKENIEDSYDKTGDDFKYIYGNLLAKRCAEIAVAGGHNLLMVGPPGTGKTMIARAMNSILPSMTDDEKLEITQVYSSAGQLKKNNNVIKKRPFRSPHHSATFSSVLGGGSCASLGEITLAHRGILFLDEMVEFPKRILEGLRQPLEDGCINISRLNRSVTYPAKFILVGTINPCPCGYYNSSKTCICKPYEIDKYINKISGPILDRIDMFCEVNIQPCHIDR